MDENSLLIEFQNLLKLSSETEWVEFKEAKTNYDFHKLGTYFSALGNEANLRGKASAWLVFGVEDKKLEIVGSNFRNKPGALDSLKREVAEFTNGMTFQEIHELYIDKKRIVLFQIPPAPKGIPISWKGHYYGRNHESLTALSTDKYEKIRAQSTLSDWSAEIIPDASLNDLDPTAISKARIEFSNKYPRLKIEMDTWDGFTFLNKAKITIKSQITRAAILLLGKSESEYLLSPAVGKISWILRDKDGIEQDYEHFGPPLILNTENAFSKVRNLKYRYIADNSLFPIEINQYDPYVIREALHNCIAHQDYQLAGRINLVETPDQLIFTNLGSFLPQSIKAAIHHDAPQEFYRNRFLAEAMVNLNMIDTIGSGIKKMFITQKNRFFPMPDYNLNSPDKVEVRIAGKILDENYTRLLINHTDLDLDTVMLLDKVQKREKLSNGEAKQLRAKKLVEGRQPNLHLSAQIAEITGDKTTYIKNRAFDKEYYKTIILSFIQQYGSANRKEIDDLLMDKLSDMLNEEQRRKKINNILYEMSKKDQSIINKGSAKNSKWCLT
ncbi:RNA-binding domain-containing protein [Saccharibacillus endophyticus]|uniref:Schlafen AlbA-2 domain-containing protein n=1 Tax=Saccharibacillus endophyticus TaxID=2060666 RepID=A0ABQ1ZZR5_9BACL|nr:RNA-binding domain-containing protein [Saccharibacillus endophyticus]GGH83426.1 hypothetical protein GCM10007362_36250 [Saccharibacillus endophyticus]